MRIASSITSAALTLVAALSVSLFPHRAYAQNAQSGQGNPCSTTKTAVVGALAGALLGKLTHKNVLAGAAVGGAVGALACVTINYHSHRTKTAEQVRQENPQVQQKPQVTVTSYQVQIDPQSLSAGQPVQVVTNMNLIPGTQEPIQKVDVQYQIIDPNGKVQQTVTKPVADIGQDGGGFQSAIGFTPPSGIPRGNYSVRTELLVNGQEKDQQTASYRII